MNMKKSILAGITAAAVVLSSGIIVFAAADTGAADEVRGFRGKSVVLSGLNDDQREAVQKARADSMKEALSDLVDSGTITQDIADQLPDSGMRIKAGAGAANLTEEQRTALHEEVSAVFESLISELIADGTLPQEQADQLDQGKRMMKGLDLTDDQRAAIIEAKAAALKAAAGNLVEDGTLTDDEADVITSLKDKPDNSRPAELLNEEQRESLQETMKSIFESKLEGLVDDGTITPEQADQLLQDKGAMSRGPGGRPGAGGPPDFKGRPDSDDTSIETQAL